MVHVETDAAAPTRPGRGAWVVTWSAFAAGIVASVAANVAHAKPTTGARLTAGWAPLALLLTIEVMMRVPAPRNRVLGFLRYAGTIAVAGVAAVASFRHMRGLALLYGEDRLTAGTLPLSVDGLVVVASIALLTLADRRREATTAAAAATAVAPMPAAVAAPVWVPPPVDPAPMPTPAAAAEPVPADPEPVPIGPSSGLAGADAEPTPVPASPWSELADADADPLPLPDQLPLPLPPAAPEPAAVADPLPLPLPPPSLEPVVPPQPWPRRDGDGAGPALDFEAALARLDAETRQLYLRAYRAYLDATAAGTTPTGRELGARCGRGERWGRDRISEVKAAQQRAAESKELAATAAR